MTRIVHFAALICALLALQPPASAAPPASGDPAGETARREWLFAFPSDPRPFTDAAELEAWLARDETIRLIRSAVRKPNTARLAARLARALLARGGRGDRDEAIALLNRTDVRLDPEGRFVRARLDLESPDQGLRAAALAEIRNLVLTEGDAAGDAGGLLGSIAARRLERAASPEERREAIALLGLAALNDAPAPREAFFRAVLAENGGVPPPWLGTAEGPERDPRILELRRRLSAPMTADDYPPGAIRAGETGTVALRGLIDPAGRLIFTEPLAAGQPPRLERALRRLYARRALAPVELGDLRAARYVWIRLPAVNFRLPD